MGIAAAVMVPHPPLIVPEIGKGEEKGIQTTIDAYHRVMRELAQVRPDTVVLLSPHQVMYEDYFHISPGAHASGDFSAFRAGQVKMDVDYDPEFAEELEQQAQDCDIPAGSLGERDKNLDHGTMVPLYFFNQYCKAYRLVRIGLSGLSLMEHYRFGECIQRTAEKLGRKTVLIASGDLSHKLTQDGPYGFHPNGPEYDRRIMEVMGSAEFGGLFDFSEDFLSGAAECGHRSFVIMAGALDKRAVAAERLSHEGPFGVGYGICSYEITGRDDSRDFGRQYEDRRQKRLAQQRAAEDEYVRLARRTIEEYVRYRREPKLPEDLLPEMRQRRAGVFVSIKKDGRLRGCIGTIQATCDCIAEEIIGNAISASTRDPRFHEITPDELDALTISVDVLGDTEDIDSPDQLDVKRYGVIVTRGSKRGLLLPNLDGVDTVEEQIAIARQKAGIGEHEKVQLSRFEVVRHY